MIISILECKLQYPVDTVILLYIKLLSVVGFSESPLVLDRRPVEGGQVTNVVLERTDINVRGMGVNPGIEDILVYGCIGGI